MSPIQVTLIRPPYVIPKTSIFGHRGTPSLSLAYLRGAIESNYSVKCIDSFARNMDKFTPIEGTNLLINGLTNKEIIDLIPKETKIIGISCMFSSEWINTSKLIKEIKKEVPNVFILLGGEHVTADYEYILKNYDEVNACILGEGESKFSTLVDIVLSDKFEMQEIPGISFKSIKESKLITTPSDYRVKDIDSIKNPSWKELNIEEFHKRLIGMSMIGKVTMPMILSRGCPYQCTFCSSANMWTTRWIPRGIDQIIEEIKGYKEKYKINHLDFFDLTAVVNKKWTIDFCNRLIRENLNLTWSLPSGTRSEALTNEVLHLLKRSGCTKLTYAPETGSVRMSKLIKKRVNLKNMISSMRHAVKEGITVKANIIFGFPEERLIDRLLNFVFIFKMAFVGVHDVPCFGFTPYPGSEIFNKLFKEGKIKKDEGYYEFMAELVYTKPFNNKSWNDSVSNNTIPILSLGGMSFFYCCQFLFRPWRVFILLKNMYRNKPNTMLEIALSNMYQDFWQGGRNRKN